MNGWSLMWNPYYPWSSSKNGLSFSSVFKASLIFCAATCRGTFLIWVTSSERSSQYNRPSRVANHLENICGYLLPCVISDLNQSLLYAATISKDENITSFHFSTSVRFEPRTYGTKAHGCSAQGRFCVLFVLTENYLHDNSVYFDKCLFIQIFFAF